MRPSMLSIPELRSRSGIKWHRYADDVLPAWVAEMDFGVAEPIQEALQRLVAEASYGYESELLYPRLADAFVAYMQRRFGWAVQGGSGGEQVLPVTDLVQAMFATVTVFSAPGDGVALLTPIYPPFLQAVRQTGRRLSELRLAEDGARFTVDRERLRQAFEVPTPLLMLCNPHNPTGRMFDRGELESIAAMVLERDMVVLVDEVHADLAYPGNTHIPFASLGHEIAERTITITSATKAYNIPGLRCGIIHFGSARLREQFRATIPDFLLGRAHRFGIEATIVAWEQCAAWLDGVIQVLDDNRQRLGRFLVDELPEIRYSPPQATYLAWLDCRALHLPTSPAQFLLDQARVALGDGADFGEPGQGWVRLNFGTSPAILEQVLERLAGVVRSERQV